MHVDQKPEQPNRNRLWEAMESNFPAPGVKGSGRYCMGGALCLSLHREGFVKFTDAFPTPSTLTLALRIANPKLSIESASQFSRSIIHYNDLYRFASAKEVLKEALWTKQED